MSDEGKDCPKKEDLGEQDNRDQDHCGMMTVNISEDGMEARADFFPAHDGGAPITQDYITAFLIENNVVYGIDYDEINRAFTECAYNGRAVKDVVIARGTPPEDEAAEYLQLNPYLGRKKKQENANAPVDHKSRSPFIIVKKGRLLAKLRPRKPGKEGMNVKGEAVPFKEIKSDCIIAGENTRMDGLNLVSEIDGQLVKSKSTVSVRECLSIKGAVGYSTGNIIFPGDVEIEGPVSDGFIIHSGGSITIKQTFDVTEASVKKDLNVAGGIIGRGRAMVKVGGTLRTKFIENCRVACRKNIIVDAEIINSNIYTLENLEMGDRGKIAGGEIYAVKGVRAFSIGRKTGRAPRIHCGIDFTAEQEKEKNNNLLKILAAKLSRLRELINDPSIHDQTKKEKMEALIKQLEDEQKKAQAKVAELLGKLNTCMDATIEASGEISEGSLIEICNTALFVTSPFKNVRIRLDRVNNKLITEKL